MTTQPSARILCDSTGAYEGVRLTTVELVMHRYVLAEFNTHRALSRNSASSRAIPVEKTLERFRHDYAWPLSLPAEQPGMSGGAELEGEDRAVAMAMLRRIHDNIGLEVANYVGSRTPEHRLHKSVLNRVMEYGQWHTVIATGDQYGWKHFLELRDHETAQPETRAVAQALRVALDESTPQWLGFDDWHLPLTAWSGQPGAEEQFAGDEDLDIDQLKKVSSARCARVSYLTHQGVRDVEADYGLHGRLLGAGGLPHVSPLEHVATPDSDSFQWANHYGWRQYRRDAELEWEAMHSEPELQVVFKYAFGQDVAIDVDWGEDSRVVLIAAQLIGDPTPTVWIEHGANRDPGLDGLLRPEISGTRTLRLAGTGQPVTTDHDYVGSAVCSVGSLVWHVYADPL